MAPGFAILDERCWLDLDVDERVRLTLELMTTQPHERMPHDAEVDGADR